MKELDGEETRHKVLFLDGTLCDFRSGEARHAKPSDGVGFATGCPHRLWSPELEVAELAKETFGYTLDFFKGRRELRHVNYRDARQE